MSSVESYEDLFKSIGELKISSRKKNFNTKNFNTKNIKTAPIPESMDELRRNTYTEHTKITHEAIKRELESKNKYRGILIIVLLGYLVLVTIAVLAMIEWNNRGGSIILSEKVELALISGIFVNLLGVVILVFRYAFSSTNEILQHSKEVLTSLSEQSNGS